MYQIGEILDCYSSISIKFGYIYLMSLLLGCVLSKLIVILLMIVFILSMYCPLSCTLFKRL